ncbi:unnamed protein product [Anisakis simplex]|uniref:Uncharacterized protein n=1 Tax=Anisakis simplex TaxID=6269 RepID=A0A3P6Q932_ANISI|nr:unnamed protein product [Anisakis simplex]
MRLRIMTRVSRVERISRQSMTLPQIANATCV